MADHRSDRNWPKVNQLTSGSERNHTYVRRAADAQLDFYALWADGHSRHPSESTLYFSDQAGKVCVLPPSWIRNSRLPNGWSRNPGHRIRSGQLIL